MATPASDVRAARRYLQQRGAQGIPARKFAAAARELGVEFNELLALIGRLYDGYVPETRYRQESIKAAAE